MKVELSPEQLKWIKEKNYNYYKFKEAPKEWLESNEFMLAAVTKCGLTLQYASEKLKDDKEIVLAAVTNDGSALQYASTKLKDDKEIVLTAVANNGYSLQYASDIFKDDKEIILTALELKFASEKLKDDKEIVLVAVANNGGTLEYASTKLKDDKEIVLVAVTNNGDALEYASTKLKDDKEIVLAAVTNLGKALKYASEKLKGDKDIVWGAVKNQGRSIEYASDELNGDPEIVLTALSHCRSWAPSLIDSHPLCYVRCEAILKEIAEKSSIGGKKINFDISHLVSGVQNLFEIKLFDENGHEKEDEIEKISNDWFDFNQIIYQNQKMDGWALLSLAQVMQLRYYPSPKDGSDVEEYTRALLIEAIELNDKWLIDIIHRGFNVDEYRDFSDLADKACSLLWNREDKDYANALMVLRNENYELTTGLSNEFVLKVIQEARELNLGYEEDKEELEKFVSEAGIK